MPEKDPMTWAAGWAALPDPIRAVIVGVIVAALRVMYDGGEYGINNLDPCINNVYTVRFGGIYPRRTDRCLSD